MVLKVLKTGVVLIMLLIFSEIKILDIGCGGGLLSEPLARFGANVTGIDASDKNVKIAKIPHIPQI